MHARASGATLDPAEICLSRIAAASIGTRLRGTHGRQGSSYSSVTSSTSTPTNFFEHVYACTKQRMQRKRKITADQKAPRLSATSNGHLPATGFRFRGH